MTRILFLDVDGTLTDGGIYLGREDDVRRFHAQDGVGIKLAVLAGIEVFFLSARENAAADRRARELGVTALLGVAKKQEHVRRLCAERGASLEEAAFVGDDLQDLGAMKIVGRAIAVGDAVSEVKAASHHVTKAGGGRGAVREAVEWILRQDHRWDDAVNRFVEASDFVVRPEAAGGSGPGSK